MKHEKFVTDWVIRQAKERYPQDIALVVAHNTLRIGAEKEMGEPVISFFVPATEKGNQLARTFVLDGVGYDIWGISWERLEKFALLEEYNVTVLADSVLLYARTPEDAKRYEELKALQKKCLSDPQISRKCALSSYEQAKKICCELLFAKDSDVKMSAGYVLDFLARAVAFTNRSYFRFSQVDQLREMAGMALVPEGFAELYGKILSEPDHRVLKELCVQAVEMIQQFLQQQAPAGTEEKNRDFQVLADWYGELAYTWLRIRHYAAEKDAQRVFFWGCYLQTELNWVSEEFGLEKPQLMERYRPEDLAGFAACADRLEQQMRQLILQGGGVIHEYADPEAFLHEV